MGRQVVVTGYAKMPVGTAVRATHGMLGVRALVDVETHEVIEGDFSLWDERNRDFVGNLLPGQNLMSDDTDFIDSVKRDYWGAAQGAICQSYKDMVRRYREHLQAEQAAAAEVDPKTPAA